MSKLELKHISKSFNNNGSKNIILNDINLSINEGEFVCILGHSGCGKSTLLRSMAMFEEVDSGEIYLNGTIINKPCPKVFMMFQSFDQLFPWKTVIDNLIYALKITKVEKDRNKAKVISEEFLKSVGLDEYVNSYPNNLSGGMKQRAALARALALNPEILLMDEPLGALDAITRKNIQNMILDLWKEYKKTIVFVTHDIDEAITLSTRILICDKEIKNIKKEIHNQLNITTDQTLEEKELYRLHLKNEIMSCLKLDK